MPKVYRRNCDWCGTYYEGYGEKYCDPGCASNARRGYDDTGLTDTLTEQGRTLAYKGERIVSLDDLIEHAQIDLDEWKVDRFKANKTEAMSKDADGEPVVTPLYHINATFKPRNDAIQARQIADRIIAQMREHAPRTFAPVDHRAPQGDHLLEPCFFDLHVGKLGWAGEVGEDFDSDILRDRFDHALEELIQKASGFKISEIVFPFGNDLLQADTLESSTHRGTRVDTDSRYAKMYAAAFGLVKYGVERLRQIAPVKPIMVPGNHDFQSMIPFGMAVDALFQHDPHVTVNASPNPRKYFEWGQCLLGFTHGDKEKLTALPQIMAAERKLAWGRTTFREWHVGHLHTKKEYHFMPLFEEQGVRVRVIPSLCGTDAWHHMKGYVKSIKSAQCFLWDRETGYAGHFDSNVTRAA